jgi:LmbE family N-acetylglucosaminyl deacetylase
MNTPADPIDTAPPPEPRADSVVFLHAHPDDEAIFTGGTIALLAAAGCAVTLVVATSGQLGRRLGLQPGDIGALREDETRQAGALLGVQRVEFLRYQDSGMPGHPANHDPAAFALADPDQAARRVAAIAAEEHAGAIVTYDAGGIYGHPDHIQVHRVGARAAALAGIPTVYESTVDRDYLHRARVPHLVDDARRALPPELSLGVTSTTVNTRIAIDAHLAAKRSAIAAHHSQVLTTSEVMTMPAATFAQVYGVEWYIRRGPAGRLDHLPAGHPSRRPRRPATAVA